MYKVSLALVCALALGAVSDLRAQSVPDSPAARQTQADRYLKATPPKEMFAGMTKSITNSIPAGPQRDQMVKMLTTGIDMDAMSSAMKDALVKTFTAEELKALADFYSSPVGKSAMSKMGDYTAELMPVMQAQMMKAMQGAGAPQTP